MNKIFKKDNFIILFRYNDYHPELIFIDTKTKDMAVYAPPILNDMIETLEDFINSYNRKSIIAPEFSVGYNCGGLHEITIAGKDSNIIVNTLYEDDDKLSIDKYGNVDHESNYHEFGHIIINCSVRELCRYFKNILLELDNEENIKFD